MNNFQLKKFANEAAKDAAYRKEFGFGGYEGADRARNAASSLLRAAKQAIRDFEFCEDSARERRELRELRKAEKELAFAVRTYEEAQKGMTPD